MSSENLVAPETESSENAPADETRSERRAWVRYQANLTSGCQPVAMPTAPQPEWRWPAVIQDISVGGVALTLERRFERGAALHVELPSNNEEGVLSLTANVARVQKLGKRWLLGCEWAVRLTEEELDTYRNGISGTGANTATD
jgi:hypothetical protein